jgi:AhpD family alkylhydroperoxidase
VNSHLSQSRNINLYGILPSSCGFCEARYDAAILGHSRFRQLHDRFARVKESLMMAPQRHTPAVGCAAAGCWNGLPSAGDMAISARATSRERTDATARTSAAHPVARRQGPMSKDWKALTTELSRAMAATRSGIPAVTTAFAGLAQAATVQGALDTKTKELVALAISIALRCDGCIGFHTKAAARLGATREEVLEIIGMAIYMGGGPSFIFGAEALEAYDQLAAPGAG